MGACGSKSIEGDVDVFIDGKETGFKTSNGIKVSFLKSEISQFGNFKIEDLAIVPQNLDTEFGDDQEVNVVGDEHIEVFNLSDMTTNQELKTKLLEKRNEHKKSGNLDDNEGIDGKSPRATKTEEINQSHSKSKRKSKKSSSKKSDDKNKSTSKSDNKEDQKSIDEPDEVVKTLDREESDKKPNESNNKDQSSDVKGVDRFTDGFGDDKGGFGDNKEGFGDNKEGFGDNKEGFGDDKGGFGNDNGGFNDVKEPFGDDKKAFGEDKSGFDDNKEGFGDDKEGFDDNKDGFGDDKDGFGEEDKGGFGDDEVVIDIEKKTDGDDGFSKVGASSDGVSKSGKDSRFNESGSDHNDENKKNGFSDDETLNEKVVKQRGVTENMRQLSKDEKEFDKVNDDEFGKNDNSDFGQEDGVFNGFGQSAQLGDGDNPFETDESNQANNSSDDHFESRITEKTSRSPSPPVSMLRDNHTNSFVNDDNDTFQDDNNNINNSFNKENDSSFDNRNNTDDFDGNNLSFKEDDNSFDNRNDSFNDGNDHFPNTNNNIDNKFNLSDNSDSFEYKNSFGDDNAFNVKNENQYHLREEITTETTKTVRSQALESQKPNKEFSKLDKIENIRSSDDDNSPKVNINQNIQVNDLNNNDEINDDRINNDNKFTESKSEINSEIKSSRTSKQYSSTLPNKDDSIKSLQEKLNIVKQSLLQRNSNNSTSSMPKYHFHTLTPTNDDSDDDEFIDHGIAEIINNNKKALEQAMLFSQQLMNYQRSLGSPTTNPTYRKYIVSDSDSDDNH